MWTYILYDNGSEVENIDAPQFDTEDEAIQAGDRALDDLCPPLSPNRRYYRSVPVKAAAAPVEAKS